eukprot:s1859_g9.t1
MPRDVGEKIPRSSKASRMNRDRVGTDLEVAFALSLQTQTLPNETYCSMMQCFPESGTRLLAPSCFQHLAVLAAPVAAVVTMAGLGIPVKLLHEGIGHTVTCELKTGEMYRGHLMNCEGWNLRQYECHAGRSHRDRPRWQGDEPGASLSARIADPILHPSGHVEARSNVQEEGPWRWPWRLWPWWQGPWEGLGSKGAHSCGCNAKVRFWRHFGS